MTHVVRILVPVVALAPGCVQTRPGAICPGNTRDHVTFDDMWHTLDRAYAVFAERLPDADWATVGEAACPKLDAGVDDDTLYDVMLDTLRTLDDGHTGLRAPDLSRSRDAWAHPYPHYDTLYDLETTVETAYLEDDLAWANNDWFAWGTIPASTDRGHGRVGYLSLTMMDELSASGNERPDVAAAQDGMRQVLAELGHHPALIVDIRANEGGWDSVSLAIARFFDGPEALVWEKQLRDGPAHDDFGPWKPTVIASPEPDAYTGQVVVLTSGGTFSAAETFTLAMHTRHHTTVLGEPTSGHLSDIHSRRLSNGWVVSFSGERYRAADGEVYEARGVPVDITTPLDPHSVDRGQDRMLEAALDHIVSTR